MKMMAIVLCIFIVFRHRSNIKRLAKGQETRVSFPFPKRSLIDTCPSS